MPSRCAVNWRAEVPRRLGSRSPRRWYRWPASVPEPAPLLIEAASILDELPEGDRTNTSRTLRQQIGTRLAGLPGR